jgi:hypothetical protein
MIPGRARPDLDEALRLWRLAGRWTCDGPLVGAQRNSGRARDDHVSSFPRPLLVEEAQLGRHPVAPERDRLLPVAVDPVRHIALDPPPLGLAEIGLHPDRRIHQRSDLALACPGPLDDYQV